MVDFKFKKSGLFAAGVLFGTAGIKILTSKDAKKLYTGCTAAVLRAKDCIMKTATNLQENAEDIYAEAKEINEERAVAEEKQRKLQMRMHSKKQQKRQKKQQKRQLSKEAIFREILYQT